VEKFIQVAKDLYARIFGHNLDAARLQAKLATAEARSGAITKQLLASVVLHSTVLDDVIDGKVMDPTDAATARALNASLRIIVQKYA
jgi:hypothetical protein